MSPIPASCHINARGSYRPQCLKEVGSVHSGQDVRNEWVAPEGVGPISIEKIITALKP